MLAPQTMSFQASDRAMYLQFMQKLIALSFPRGPAFDAMTAWEGDVKQFAGEFGAALLVFRVRFGEPTAQD